MTSLMRILVALVSIALAASRPPFDPALNVDHSHEDHPGLVGVAGDHPGHQHGDADDHHETPDSPCHHHQAHLCCGQVPNFTPALCSGLELTKTSQRCAPLEIRARSTPSVRRHFHIPIA